MSYCLSIHIFIEFRYFFNKAHLSVYLMLFTIHIPWPYSTPILLIEEYSGAPVRDLQGGDAVYGLDVRVSTGCKQLPACRHAALVSGMMERCAAVVILHVHTAPVLEKNAKKSEGWSSECVKYTVLENCMVDRKHIIIQRMYNFILIQLQQHHHRTCLLGL